MHIRLDEALMLLSRWRNRETSLRLHVSGSGAQHDLQGTIQDLQGTVVEVLADQAKLQLDLEGAEFNGDESTPAYLVCEFRDGNRYAFYALRGEVG
jgi:hypothetical protein